MSLLRERFSLGTRSPERVTQVFRELLQEADGPCTTDKDLNLLEALGIENAFR